MKILNQQFQTVPIDAVRSHPKNPRRGNLEAIAESVEANGFYGAIIAQKSTGYILAGNHRHQTLAKGGAMEIPVIFVDVDDAQAEKMMLADNKTADMGGYDERALAELLASVGELEGTGYSSEEFDALMAEITEPSNSMDEPPKNASEDNSHRAPDQTAKLKEKFDVLVKCASESQQSAVLVLLADRGYDCKALIS